jgi:hypothetical protein
MRAVRARRRRAPNRLRARRGDKAGWRGISVPRPFSLLSPKLVVLFQHTTYSSKEEGMAGTSSEEIDTLLEASEGKAAASADAQIERLSADISIASELESDKAEFA